MCPRKRTTTCSRRTFNSAAERGQVEVVDVEETLGVALPSSGRFSTPGTLTAHRPAPRASKEAVMKKVLITGAGTGFGHEVAMRLALKGFDVIAAVEVYAQVQTLKREAAARGVTLQVEKLDVTSDGDRKKALSWEVEILVNNAGVLEGGSVLDIPGPNMRHEFEVNVIGPLLLTQGIAKQMVKRRQGRIVWVSSREGLNVNPFTGVYSASKHAVEAIAETMSLELQEFG